MDGWGGECTKSVLQGYAVSLWANAPAMLQSTEGWVDGGRR